MSQIALRRTNLPSTAPEVKTVEPFVKDMPGEVRAWNSDTATARPGNTNDIFFFSFLSGVTVSLVSIIFVGSSYEMLISGGIVTALSVPTMITGNVGIQYSRVKNLYREAFGITPDHKTIRQICKIQNKIKTYGIESERRYLSRSDLGIDGAHDETGKQIAVGLVIGREECSIMWERQDALSSWDEAMHNVVDIYALDQSVPEISHKRAISDQSSVLGCFSCHARWQNNKFS